MLNALQFFGGLYLLMFFLTYTYFLFIVHNVDGWIDAIVNSFWPALTWPSVWYWFFL